MTVKLKESSSFNKKVIKTYLVSAALSLSFYFFAFHIGIIFAENSVAQQRITIVAPHHFQLYKTGTTGTMKVDPILTIYDDYHLLPKRIKEKIETGWLGNMQVHFDNDDEFQLFAQSINIGNSHKTIYALEQTNMAEWNDFNFVLVEFLLILIGIFLFFTSAFYMTKATNKLTYPFLDIASQLKNENVSDFSPISTSGEKSSEFIEILGAINDYREQLCIYVGREKSFARYVSHELRNPMMVIKGAISNLRQHAKQPHQKPIDKIVKATNQMQELTSTFLLLAQNDESNIAKTTINEVFIEKISHNLQSYVDANEVDFNWQLSEPFSLPAYPELVHSVLENLLKNAICCSLQGKVSLLISKQEICIIDNGVGLNNKPRGYEGFGVGLVLVNDICSKYKWQFTLKDNESKGCSATIKF